MSFISTFLYKLEKAQNLPLYKQPKRGIFQKDCRQGRCISQEFMFSVQNSPLFQPSRTDFE